MYNVDSRSLFSIKSLTMMKWATSLVLVLVIAGSVFASLPIHFGGHDCGMMDCCETEKATAPSHHGEAPKGQAATLYCFLNCPQPTVPTRSGTEAKSSPSASADNHPAVVQTPAAVPVASLRLKPIETHQKNSHPVYIRHLALLI